MRYQKHIYNWGLGSTFRDFCIIWACFAGLWGFTGLLFFVTMAAHLASQNSAGALWMFAFMMALGWLFIGIALHARGVVAKREAKTAAVEEA